MAIPSSSTGPQASITLAPGTVQGAWSRATEPRRFSFPEDHGPHTEYLTEWWYYTGNLQTGFGRSFAYQLTFFRRGLEPGLPKLNSQLGIGSLYFAHFAIMDPEGGSHREWERFGRGAADLAGAEGTPFRVWVGDWTASGQDRIGESVWLQADTPEGAIDLQLTAQKPVVAHGDQGLSPKSDVPGSASYYLSFTRMTTTGALRNGDESFQVEGLSWFDHEWSTSALGELAVGWDWFSLQLDDGSDLMLFQIRNQDGSLEPVSSGTYVDQAGHVQTLELEDFSVEVLGDWTSGESGIEYPAEWRLRVPTLGLELHLNPLLNDQEVNLSTIYWEGAVRVEGSLLGRPLHGRGFVELTGYGESMQGLF